MTSAFHVNIKTKQGLVYDGDITALSSFNDLGLFDILPEHENFISIIKNKIILYKNKSQKEIKIETGVLKVKDNYVNIYLGL